MKQNLKQTKELTVVLLIVVIAALLAGCLPGDQGSEEATPAIPVATAVSSPTLQPTNTPTAVATPATEITPDPPTPQPDNPNGPERITFAPGVNAVAINGVMPGQSQKVYLLTAAAGQSARITVTSPEVSVLFHLHGQEDGVDYKHMLDGELSWEGALPVAQDYVLTLDALGEGQSNYTLEVTLWADSLPDNPGGPLHPIVDGATGYLLGGWRNDSWLDAASYAPLIADGERPYIFYNLSGEAGAATGQPPLIQGVCSQPAATLSPMMPGSVGLVGRWLATPRLPVPLATDQAVYRQAVAEALHNAGLPEPDVHIDQILLIDLEGDGVDELLITASRLTAGLSQPQVAAGDYALALLRKVVGNEVVTIPLHLDLYPEAAEPAFPWRYEITAVADLNGDGRLEIVVAANRYEGRRVTIFTVQERSASAVLQGGCAQ